MPEVPSYTWTAKKLGTMCQLAGGYGFPESFQGYVEGELPFIKVSDMSLSGNERRIVNANNYVNMRLAESMGWKPFPAGAIVFAKVGAALKLNRRRILIRPTLIDNNMMAAIPMGGLDSAFLYHFLCSVDFGNFVQDGALPSVNQEQIASIEMPDTSESEQRRIAEILDTIDEAIQKTEALISKLKAMKQGMLHDLLTRGLDEKGKLRDPKAHPWQFKDSPLGSMPKAWHFSELSKFVFHAEYGISASLEDDSGISVLRMNNLVAGEVDLSDLKYSKSREAMNLLLKPRDVLFNRTNSMEHVGRTAIWRGQLEKISFASYLVRLMPDYTNLIPEYLNLWLNSQSTQLLIRKYATPGVHQVNINPTNLRKVNIALPQEVEEQYAIVNALDAHDARIRTEEQYRDKLKLQKKGLMHDLLTGKVRVNGNFGDAIDYIE